MCIVVTVYSVKMDLFVCVSLYSSLHQPMLLYCMCVCVCVCVCVQVIELLEQYLSQEQQREDEGVFLFGKGRTSVGHCCSYRLTLCMQ